MILLGLAAMYLGGETALTTDRNRIVKHKGEL